MTVTTILGTNRPDTTQLSNVASVTFAPFHGDLPASYVGTALFAHVPAMHYVGLPSIAPFVFTVDGIMAAEQPEASGAGFSFTFANQPIEASYLVPLPKHPWIEFAETPSLETPLVWRLPAKAEEKEQSPRLLRFFPASEKLVSLYDLLSVEISRSQTETPNDLTRALLPLLGKVFSLGYEAVSLEIVGRKSIFFSLKFRDSLTVHLEAYMERLEDIGKNCFYSCFREKKCIRTGHGSIDPIVAEIKTWTSQTESARAKIA